ncbi:MAG: AcrB/AcrD/AcrF family protein [Parcubacteria group bacterium GW2011_GWC1_45_14]|nr:MAG: AcrB/AcrD/AcrF family protein [Candidatus Moranbacteria bacterium GW2011_GWC2_45_10]KKT95219.1 MAG: AcrB/AcrD/AcrF family protein [Parcubacteria group bacterium GW2011_GWC1_45_14]
MENKAEKLGLPGKMTRFFLENREFGILSMIVIFAWGIFSFFTMPKQYNPEIVAPAFNVVTEFPGADSEEVYELITRRMEDKVKEIPAVDEVMSRSMEGGTSIVTVKFHIGENLENAKITLAQKLRDNMGLKPLGAEDPQIASIDPEDIPIMNLGLTSETFSEESLRSLAFDLADRLKQVEKTSNIEIKGGKTKQLSVNFDAGKINLYEITLDGALEIIKQNNLNSIPGVIDGFQQNFTVEIRGSIENAENMGKVIIKQSPSSTVRLSDVADITYDGGEIENYMRLSQKDSSLPVVNIAISKLKGSNVMTVSKDLEKEIVNLRENFLPDGVKMEILRDDGAVASEAVLGLTSNLFTSVLIVALVLLVFLSFKSALIVAVSIPLTLAAVFGIGSLAGQNINRITLFALILSLGLLVDSATVVIENIWRKLKADKVSSKKEIIIRAVDEVGMGLFMSTVTTILAFYPMAFVTGMMGPYMGPIPFFVPAALIASLLISYTINPFLADILIKKHDTDDQEKTANAKQKISNRLMDSIRKRYADLLKDLLENDKKRKFVILSCVAAFFLVMTFPVFQIVKFRMLPKADKEQFYLYLDLPSGSSLEKTDGISKKIEEFLLKKETVTKIQSFVGDPQIVDFNGLFKGSDARTGENQATLKINLVPKQSRKETSEQIALAIREELSDELQNEPDAKIKIVEDPPGPPVLSTVLVKIQGDNIRRSKEIALDMEAALKNISEVVDIDNSLDENSVEYVLRIDQEKAGSFGVSSAQISNVLRTALSGSAVGIYHKNDDSRLRKPEPEYIVARLKKQDRDQEEDLAKIWISNSKGEHIPLLEIAREADSEAKETIYSDERRKTSYVSAEMGERSSAYAMIDMLKFLRSYELENGNGKISSWSLFGVDYVDKETGETFSVALDGEWKLTLEVFRDLGIAMAVAIFLIYFVLVAQFRSLKVPLLVMGTIPLAMIGVMPGFALLGAIKGTYFNATSMIGVIALAGIVVNNAIILLEYLNELKARKYGIREALLETGKTRFLPIILTSITTILGSLTIISDPVWEGLAWSIIWGLSLSTALTLVIFPLLYYTFEKNNWEK